MIGKKIRIERILDRNSTKAVMIPVDHGVTVGPVTGLVNMRQTIRSIALGGANAVVMHKGLVETALKNRGEMGLIFHLSASTQIGTDQNSKTLICAVEEAIKLGADAVSIHVNLGTEEEKSMLRDLGVVSRKAMEWGMPLLAMIYSKTRKGEDERDAKIVKHSARLGAELGADLVKVPYTGSPESFREVVEGCFVPVIIAGGGKKETDEDILEMVKGAMIAGGAGVSIGRNVFQHQNPSKIVRAICQIVHQSATVDEALKE
ncbi:MAG TPA: 2-amino-3,7-dideoxy-D-threo-hept-6-ulosonate synthase [Thermodesulfobacteriota bacterium]|nr:2-amino-3,7-dideoxy-D-threo-hept-6-ulosonate synthase [Thermodesulfobacteriota bacterium]